MLNEAQVICSKPQHLLPIGWANTQLGVILMNFESGGRPKGGVRNITAGIPSIGGEHLTADGKFNFEEIRYIPHEFYEEMTKGKIQKGDVLIVKDGATTGKTAIIRSDFPYEKAAVNEHVFITRPFQDVDNLYLFYYLYSPYGQDYVQKNFKGTAQGGINLTFAKETFIPLPPTEEQHRIVAKIEELFTKLDAGIEALKKIKAQLKRYRQAVLKYAFEGKLTAEWRKAHKNELEPASVLLIKVKEERKKKGGFKELPQVDTSNLSELPESWTWTPLGRIVEFEYGKGLRKDRRVFGGTVPVYGSNGIVGYHDIPLTNNACLVIGRKGALGEVHLSRVPCWPIDTTYYVYASNGINLYFLYYLLCTLRLNALDKSTAIPGLNRNDAYKLSIPVASTIEQQKIVEEIDRHFSMADEIERVVDQGLKQAERLRQSILKRAFAGKLVPQDPNDEPAEKLLKRIKLEKLNKQYTEDNSKVRKKGKNEVQ